MNNAQNENIKKNKKYNIAVAGTGYVGLSIATLLAQYNHVIAVDIVAPKVEMINNKKSPIQDEYIEKFLSEKNLDLHATLDAKVAYQNADFVVIAAPTNYDSKKNFFDCSAVEAVIEKGLSVNSSAMMVIKSTIPVGFTESVRKNITQKTSFSVRNFYVNPRLYTITFILQELLFPAMNHPKKKHAFLHPFYKLVP